MEGAEQMPVWCGFMLGFSWGEFMNVMDFMGVVFNGKYKLILTCCTIYLYRLFLNDPSYS